MQNQSPLFHSSLELFGHAISHFVGKKPFDRKMVILHLANAVELILKDMVLRNGLSIYDKPKETISTFKALKTLEEKGVPIPLRHHIDMLIDERNTLQHRFGSPEEIACIYYMDTTQAFFNQVMTDVYDQDFMAIIVAFTDKDDFKEWQNFGISDGLELQGLEKYSQIQPLGAYLSSWAYFLKVSSKFKDSLGKIAGYSPDFPDLQYSYYERLGIKLPNDLKTSLRSYQELSLTCMRGDVIPDAKQVKSLIEDIKKYEEFIGSLDTDQINKKISHYNTQFHRETSFSHGVSVGYEHMNFLDETPKNKLQDALENLYDNGETLYSSASIEE